MKKLFSAIRASDLEMVRQIIEKEPELVKCVAKMPPKKDAGADDSYKAPNLGYSIREFCSEGSISILFDEVFGCDIEFETI